MYGYISILARAMAQEVSEGNIFEPWTCPKATFTFKLSVKYVARELKL